MKAVLEKHKEVFQEGTGTIQGYKAHIHMKEKAQAKFRKAGAICNAREGGGGAYQITTGKHH